LFRKYPDIDRLSLLHTDSYIARNSREVISILPRNIYLSKTSLDFLQILNPARLFGIKLDHDRVYAFLSVATGAKGRIDLQPDYTVPAVDIYADVARQYLRAARDVNLLCFVQYTNSTIIQSNVPSWVPRWDLNLFDIAVFNLSLSTYISLSLPSSPGNLPLLVSDDILKVRGVIFDHVSFTSDLLSRTASVDDICNLWGLVSRPGASCPYLRSYKAMAFVQALSFGVSYDDRRSWKRCERTYIRLLNEDAGLSR
jgi:hypothetical protein